MQRTTVLGFRLALKKFPEDVTSPELHMLRWMRQSSRQRCNGSRWVEPGVEAHDVRG